MDMTLESYRLRNGICADALKEGDRLRIGHWEFWTRVFHETYEPAVKTTGIHSHENLYELSMMNLGRMEYRMGGRTVETSSARNDWVLIPAGQQHSRTCHEPPAVIHGYLFEAECFRESSWPVKKLDREIEKAGYYFPGTPELGSLHRELLSELSSSRPLKAHRLSFLIRDLLLCFLREYFPFLAENRQVQGSSSETSLSVIGSYIDENISNKLSLEDISRCCGLSSRHANRLFTSKHGVSLGKFVLEKRLRIARREIEGTSRQIKEIALELGYDDISYFNRIYRKAFGMTPTECRKRRS